MTDPEFKLLSVNVGRPQPLGSSHGEPVISAIDKRPLNGAFVPVGTLGLEGDAQADLEVHGGPDKAVYAYPADNWDWWEKEHGVDCRPGAFGENLTIEGGDETSLRIGDRFAWGMSVLEISQPRSPCYKFQIYSKHADAGALMVISGRCGWYLRVVTPGPAPIGGKLSLIQTSGGPTVRETFLIAFDRRADASRRREIALTPALSEAWRQRLLKGTP